MKKIYKYSLELTPSQEIWLPQHAQILSVQAQTLVKAPGYEMQQLMLWAMVNPDESAPKDKLCIEIYPTGNEVDLVGRSYLGTVQLGPTVWHVFTRVFL